MYFSMLLLGGLGFISISAVAIYHVRVPENPQRSNWRRRVWIVTLIIVSMVSYFLFSLHVIAIVTVMMMELGVVSKNLLATEATQATQGQTASVMTLVGFGLIGTALFVSHSFRFTTDKYTAYRKRQKDADRNT